MSAGPSLATILGALEPHGMRFDLEPFAARLAALGDPQRGLPAVLVAGTNGKGSVASLLAAILQAAGYRVGLYTSPHLESPVERVRIDGRALAAPRLARRLAEAVAAGAPRLAAPTYFEALTAAAFLEFAAERVDCAVLEVGLGGRLDATNLAEPRLSIVTAIGHDHEALLGRTLPAIAGEKAGIFRRGVPAVLAPQRPAALAALAARARAIGAPRIEVERRARFPSRRGEGLLRIETDRMAYRLSIELAGSYQVANVATAVIAAESLAELGYARIDAAAVTRGAAAWRWPGRLETVVLPRPYPEVLFDGAHNPDGAAALARHWRTLGRGGTLVFGALADKRIERMLPGLARCADRVVLTRPDSPRAADPEELRRYLPDRLPCHVEPKIGEAVDFALAQERRRIVVSGSLFLAGAVRRALRRRFRVPPPPGPTFVG